MTGEKKKTTDSVAAPVYITGGKSRGGMTLAIVGITEVTELNSERIILSTRAGNIEVTGERLVLSIFTNKTVEISGRITGVNFGYGRS